MTFSHTLFCDMPYNSGMNCLKKSFIHFLFFSFFMAVPCAVCLAESAQEALPPLPSEQARPFFPPKHVPSEQSDLRSEKRPDVMHYRGNRVYAENLPFEISCIRCRRLDENLLALHIVFNQSINPRSISRESILVNGMPLPDDIRFAFNRKGDTIKIIIFQREKSFKLKIQNVTSFDGKEFEATERLIEVDDQTGE